MSKLGYEAFVSGMQQLANTINAIRQQESQQKFQKQQAGLDRQQQRDLQSNQFVQQREMVALELTNRLKEMKEANTYQTGRDEALHGYDMAKMGKANEYTQSNMRLQSGLNQKDAFYSYNLDAYSRGIADKIKLAQLANLNMVNQATADTYGYDIDTTTGEVYPPAKEPISLQNDIGLEGETASMFNFGEDELDILRTNIDKATKLSAQTPRDYSGFTKGFGVLGWPFEFVGGNVIDPLGRIGARMLSGTIRKSEEQERKTFPAKTQAWVEQAMPSEKKAIDAINAIAKKGGALTSTDAQTLLSAQNILYSATTNEDGTPTRKSRLDDIINDTNALTVDEKKAVRAQTTSQMTVALEKVQQLLATSRVKDQLRKNDFYRTYDANLEKINPTSSMNR